MVHTSTARELRWEQKQRADRIQSRIDHREWLRNFAFAIGLIIITVAIAMLLARSVTG